MEKIVDRNYILDDDGNYLKIIGNVHPENSIVSYVKYFPSEFGFRDVNGVKCGYNSFVAKSFVILGSEPDRVCHSEHHGSVVTCTPTTKIKKIFDTRDKLQEILRNKDKYLSHKVGSELVDFLEKIERSVDLSKVGITGSFLVDAYLESSDIDLVCFGKNIYHQMQQAFKNHTYQYKGQYADILYKRRMTHMDAMNFDMLILQEGRKLQGLTKKKKIHINCQPLREPNDDIFLKLSLIDVGYVECIAEVTKDSEGIFAPAVYEIKVLDVIDSLFSGDKLFKEKLKVFISYIGGYSNSFRNGDRIYIKGELLLVTDRITNETFYGIEMTPWHSSSFHKANLLSVNKKDK